MKPAFLLTVVIVFISIMRLNAQTKVEHKQHYFSFNISMSDYSLPSAIKDSTIGKAIQQKDWIKPGNKSFGIGLSFWKSVSAHINFSGTFTGTLASFPANFVKGDSVGQATFCPQLDALLHFNLLHDRTLVNPFLTAGIGAGNFPGQFAAYAPMGIGLQFHFNDGACIILQAQWRKALTAGINNDYIQYALSFAQKNKTAKNASEKKVSKKPIPVVPVQPLVLDTDQDGVPDSIDKCPAVKGTVNGCPDSDHDGIADMDDKCPDVTGVARFFGCPVPDTDKDGINDEEDRCPSVAGLKENQGCPVTNSNKIAATDTMRYIVYFEPGKNILRSEGFDVLNTIVQQLKQNKALVVTCIGHTDNVGNKSANYNLSLARATVCESYITSFYIGKGRVSSVGLGSTMPAADLSDPLQQWKNRRTEILVYQVK